MTGSYCTLDQLRARLGLRSTDSRSDETLEGIIEAVSRAIDAECGTQFYSSSQTRYFTATCGHELLVDDLLSISSNGLRTDLNGDGTFETTWAASDFVLAPYNAPTLSQPRPYWKIEVANVGTKTFPVGLRRGVQIAGSWGFSAEAPKVVEVVCLREALYRHQAGVTPYGMTAGDGSVAAPPTMRLSQNSRSDLAQFKRLVFA